MTAGIPAVVAGNLVVTVGHEGDLCGLVFQHEGYELRDRVAFDIELCRETGLQVTNILIADVALVGTGVHGDALRTEALAVEGYLQDIGVVAATRIANRGDFIDVDT